MNDMTALKRPELTLLLPVKDEEEAIPAFLETIIPILEALDDKVAQSFEILFIDDGSTDATMPLVREANRDALNPFLMPGDAIACYDSRWTNFREAVGFVSEAVNTATPAILLDNAL